MPGMALYVMSCKRTSCRVGWNTKRECRVIHAFVFLFHLICIANPRKCIYKFHLIHIDKCIYKTLSHLHSSFFWCVWLLYNASCKCASLRGSMDDKDKVSCTRYLYILATHAHTYIHTYIHAHWYEIVIIYKSICSY